MNTNMNIERNKDLVEILTMIAGAARKFNEFTKNIKDEGIDEDIRVIKSELTSCIGNVSVLESYFFTCDLIDYVNGENTSTESKET